MYFSLWKHSPVCGAVVIWLIAIMSLSTEQSVAQSTDTHVQLLPEGGSNLFTYKTLQLASYFLWSHNNRPMLAVYTENCTVKEKYDEYSTVLDTGVGFHIICNSQLSQSLLLSNISRRHNASRWACLAFDETGLSEFPTHELLLNVAVVPSSVSIHVSGTNLQEIDKRQTMWVYEGQTLALGCISKEGYPKPNVIWYSHYVNAKQALLTSTSESVSEKDGLFTVHTTHTILVSRDHDRTAFICESLIEEEDTVYSKMQALVQLFIEYPPRPLQISGKDKLENGDDVIVGGHGQEITLECISRQGYPQPSVHWYAGNETAVPLLAIQTISQLHGLFTVSSRYTFTPMEQDNWTMYTCRSVYHTDIRHVSMTTVRLYLRGDDQNDQDEWANIETDGQKGDIDVLGIATDKGVTTLTDSSASTAPMIGVATTATIVIVGLTVALALSFKRKCKSSSETENSDGVPMPDQHASRAPAGLPSPAARTDGNEPQYDTIDSNIGVPTFLGLNTTHRASNDQSVPVITRPEPPALLSIPTVTSNAQPHADLQPGSPLSHVNETRAKSVLGNVDQWSACGNDGPVTKRQRQDAAEAKSVLGNVDQWSACGNDDPVTKRQRQDDIACTITTPPPHEYLVLDEDACLYSLATSSYEKLNLQSNTNPPYDQINAAHTVT